MKILIPNNSDEITVEQFIKANKDKENERHIIHSLTGIPIEDVGTLKKIQYDRILKSCIEGLNDVRELKPIIKIKGIEYGIIPNFDEITQDEYSDLCRYYGNIEDYHKFMAVCYRKVVSKDRKGNYTIEKYKGTKDRADIMLESSLSNLSGVLSFFLHLLEDLKVFILRSTEEAEQQKVKQ